MLLALLVPDIAAHAPKPRMPNGRSEAVVLGDSASFEEVPMRNRKTTSRFKAVPSKAMRDLAEKIEINSQHTLGLQICNLVLGLIVMSLASVLVAKMKNFEVQSKEAFNFVQEYNENAASA